MTKVIADISMSIDGFVTGPDAGPDNGLGTGGEPLHTWVFEDHEVDRAALQRSMDDSGAVVMGRRLFDIVDAPGGWSDDMGYGADLAGQPPFFVVTHQPPEQVRLSLDFTFCAGIAAAIDRAKAAAGDKAVLVMGGGSVIAQCLEAGLVDERDCTSRRSCSVAARRCSTAWSDESSSSARSRSRPTPRT